MKNYNTTVSLIGNFNPSSFQPEWFFENEIENFETAGPLKSYNRTSESVEFTISSTGYKVDGGQFVIIGYDNLPIEILVEKLKTIFCSHMRYISANVLRVQRYVHLKYRSVFRRKISNSILQSCPWNEFVNDIDLHSMVTNSQEKLNDCNLTKFVIVEKSNAPNYNTYLAVELHYLFDEIQTVQNIVSSVVGSDLTKRVQIADDILESIRKLARNV